MEKNMGANCYTDRHLGVLLDMKQYFGEYGAISYFRKKYLGKTREILVRGDTSSAIMYLHILSMVMHDCSNSNLFKKIYAFRLMYIAYHWAEHIRSVIACCNIDYSPKDYYVFMFFEVRCLQILKRAHLFDVFKGTTKKLYGDLENHLALLNRLARLVKIPDFSTKHYRLASAKRHLLMVEGLLFELNKDNIRTLENFSNVKSRISVYCGYNQTSNDVEVMETIQALLMSIGDYDQRKRKQRAF